MNTALPLLAELDDADKVLLKNICHSGWSQTTIIFCSLGGVAVLLFLFVFLFRKRLFGKRKRHHHHHRESVAPAPEEAQPKRRRSRHLRREHRPLNPALAQTHGLPPIRDPNQPPPGL